MGIGMAGALSVWKDLRPSFQNLGDAAASVNGSRCPLGVSEVMQRYQQST
jgi:hypothetical protein